MLGKDNSIHNNEQSIQSIIEEANEENDLIIEKLILEGPKRKFQKREVIC